MTRKTIIVGLVALLQTGAVCAHDMFLKLTSFYLESNVEATIALYNGTFDKSENSIERDRMIDVRIVGPEQDVEAPEDSAWSDRDNATWLEYKTGPEGTYLAGVSTRARSLSLAAEEFNEYLEHDGVLDMLERRRSEGLLDQAATELYSKHVKAIFQVGDTLTDAWSQPLGYPIEIVPLANPYSLGKGDTFEFRVLRDGRPVANQLVHASHGAFHGHGESGGHVEAVTVRTDDEGTAAFEIVATGKWYVRLIHMVETDQEGLTHESNWTTLTFEVAE